MKSPLRSAMQVLLLGATLALGGGQAAASILWSFSWNGEYITGGSTTASGQLITEDTPDGNGFYLVTGISGTWNGFGITGLGGFGSGNNLVAQADPQLDLFGLSFIVSGAGVDGNGNVNLFSKDGSYRELAADFSTGAFGTFVATQVPVPEPMSLLLVASSLALLGVVYGRPLNRPGFVGGPTP
jgi:hypothetical protein